jgi:lipoprotein-releasing system permease protein
LNTELFIAKRLFSGREAGKFSRPILSFNVIGIALGVAVMVISVIIVTGFKNEITEKVIGFGSHIQITNFDSNRSYETLPVQKDEQTIHDIKSGSGITEVSVFANKYGILKKELDFQGVVLKGVDKGYNWSFFEKSLVDGHIPQYSDTATSNDILVSEYVASALKLNVGDPIGAFFIQKPPRMRRFNIAGIYKTTLEEFDQTFVMCDIQHVQKLNGWTNDQISGYEITTDNYKMLDYYALQLFNKIGNQFFEEGSKLKISTITEKYPYIFDWLNLQDINVWVILIIMITVACFNIIAGLLILVLDRTQMIGILKALGTTNRSIKKVFIYQSLLLAFKGIVIGNLIGLGICFVQWKFNLLKLDQSAYFLDAVPVNFNIPLLFLLNIGIFLIIFLILLLPSIIISKIDPAKSIRFE